MSSKNNDNSAAATAVGIAGAGMAFAFLFLFAIAAFATFVLTILCLIACFTPLRLGKWTLTQEEASAFLLRGVAGMWLVPAFVLFCDVIFQIGIIWDYLPHMMGVGYVLGSLGWGLLTAETEMASTDVEVIPPAQQITHQPKPTQGSAWQQPHQNVEPFRYASWDDDEELPQ